MATSYRLPGDTDDFVTAADEGDTKPAITGGLVPQMVYGDGTMGPLKGTELSAGGLQSLEGVNTETDITGALWATNTWTGAGEQNNLDNVGVSLQVDETGTLFFDFSVDGTNWTTFPVNGFKVASGTHEFHTAVKLGRYFRPRFVGDGGRSYIRLFTYYGNSFLPSNAPVNQSLGADSDAIIVRTASDHKLDLARGFIGGHTVIHKFGSNPSITASSTEDINFSGTIYFPTVATTVRVKAGNAADTTDGNGARTVRVTGLDQNFADASEDLTTAGGSASSSTTTTFIRVFRSYVLTVGVYGAANTANVVIEDTAGNNDFVTIAAGVGQTETSLYTVPAGKTAYLTQLRAEVDASKAADVKMFQRQDADDIAAPFTGKRIVADLPALIGVDNKEYDSYLTFPAKTDLWWTGTTGAGAAPAVQVDYDLTLVDD